MRGVWSGPRPEGAPREAPGLSFGGNPNPNFFLLALYIFIFINFNILSGCSLGSF